MRYSVVAPCLLGLVAVANGQVTRYFGPSTNLTTALDFDSPAAPAGPISSTSTVFTAVGITSINLVGTWLVGTDTLTVGSNVYGQSLVSQGGTTMSVAGPAAPLDNPQAGAGFDIVLANLVDEFQCIFSDQVNHTYTVELFNGATSLGSGSFIYENVNFPVPPHYWRAAGPFNRILITFPATVVGVGIDELAFGNGPLPPPLPPNCAETLFTGGNFGNLGGNTFFDLTVTQPVTISGLLTNYMAAAGTPVGMAVHTTPTTYVGSELNQAAWTQAAIDNGAAVSAGQFARTAVTFATPLQLTPGTYGICVQVFGSAQLYTNGNGTNQSEVSADGVLSLALGAAQNTPFVSVPFTPRVWNGQVCHDVSGLGTNYCTAVPNSTGNTGSISATGSAIRANNDVTLEASSLPNNSFGFFLTSRTQGFTANPGGSMGNLCLGSPIGRYVGPGQIKNTGLLGAFSLVLDLSQTPTPTGLVSINAGETWNFQSWHRDAVGGVATSNFTDGLSISFL
jgi:hypothetical protein